MTNDYLLYSIHLYTYNLFKHWQLNILSQRLVGMLRDYNVWNTSLEVSWKLWCSSKNLPMKSNCSESFSMSSKAIRTDNTDPESLRITSCLQKIKI